MSLGRAAAVFEGIAAVFLSAMMLLTVADVALRSLDVAWRIFGVVEMVELMLDATIFLALPAVFLMSRNIVVNLFDDMLPRRALRVIVLASAFVSLLYLALVLSQIVVSGLESIEFGDQTMHLAIPAFAFWLPVWIGFAGALLAVIVVMVVHRGNDDAQGEAPLSHE